MSGQDTTDMNIENYVSQYQPDMIINGKFYSCDEAATSIETTGVPINEITFLKDFEFEGVNEEKKCFINKVIIRDGKKVLICVEDGVIMFRYQEICRETEPNKMVRISGDKRMVFKCRKCLTTDEYVQSVSIQSRHRVAGYG